MNAKFAGLAIASLMMGCAWNAGAADVAGGQYGDFYVKAAGGMAVPEDLNFKAATTSTGVQYTGSGQLQKNPGEYFSLSGGYKLNKYLTTEVELAYTHSSYNQISGAYTATYNGTTYTGTGAAPLKGDTTTYLGATNVLVAPLGRNVLASRWWKDVTLTPVIGGGIGLANITDKLDSIDTLSVGVSSSETDMLLQGIVGFDVQATKQFLVGARYKYVWLNTGSSVLDNSTSHVMTADVTYKF